MTGPEDESAGDGTTETGPDGHTDDSGQTDIAHTGATAPFLFLLGVLGFLGGGVAFLADVVTGHDVVRSLVVNAAGALVLVGWAAADTLSDPDSAVDSRGGALGTALLLYGLYLLAVAVVVGLTSVWHDRFQLALLCGGGGLVITVVGFLVFPVGTVVGDTETDESTPERADESSGE